MLLDNKLVLSDSQAITGDAVSDNVLDLGVAERAPGNNLDILAHVEEDFDNLTSLNIEVESSVDEAFTAPIKHQKINVLLADLTAGKQIDLGALANGTDRYVRLNYDVDGSNPSAGIITAAIVPYGQQTLPNQA